MHSPVLAKRVHELKDTQKGATLMCHEMEKFIAKEWKAGMDVKKIARLVKVSEDDIQKWIDENMCVAK